MKKQLWISVLFVVACGDNKRNPDIDAGPDVDAPQSDAPIDTPPQWTQPEARSFQLSATRPDVIMSAAAGPNGGFYAAGYLDTDVDPDPNVTTIERRIIVLKLDATGVLDGTFGTGGKADTGFVFRGGNDDIDILTLANGDILVSATVNAEVANAADPVTTPNTGDTDIGLIKLSPTNGALVTAWGTNGIEYHSFNTSLAAANRDASRGLAVGADGSIYVSGAGRGPGNQQPGNTVARTDVDWYVAKLTPAGALATTWGDADSGQRAVDLFIPAVGTTEPNLHQPATVRSLIVLPDGSVISGGYVSGTLTTSPQAVVFKLDPNGDLATTFSEGGIFHQTVFGGQTEVYNFALHGDKVVTGGYGRNGATGPNDWVSMRFDIATGARDMTWGGAAQGKNLIDADPTINDEGSNCHNAIALPNGKTLLVGSSGTSPQGQPPSPARDAVFVVLAADGTLDTTYGDGRAKYKLDGTDDGADQFWGAAVNGNKVLIVGWRGATIANPQTEANNDNSYGVILDLE